MRQGFYAAAVIVSITLGSSDRATAVAFDYSAGTCSIDGVDPSDCFGGIYSIDLTLTVDNEVVGGQVLDTYVVGMHIDTISSSSRLIPELRDGSWINAEFKLLNSEYLNATVLGTEGTGGVIDPMWTFGDGPLNGMGCGGKNGDFLCLTAGDPSVLPAVGEYWISVQFQALDGTDVGIKHLGFRLLDSNNYGHVVSLPIPEPDASVVFMLGLAIVCWAMRHEGRPRGTRTERWGIGV